MDNVSHMTHLVALFALDARKLRVKCRPFLITMKHTRPGNITGWLPSLGLVMVLPLPLLLLPLPTSSPPHCLAYYTREIFF